MGLLELVIVGGLFLIGCVLSAFERYSLTVGYLVALFVGSWFFFDPAHDFIVQNWREILFHQVPLYIGVGIGIAVLKWFSLVIKRASAIRDAKETFKPDNINPRSRIGTSEDADKLVDNPDALRRFKFIQHWNDTSLRHDDGGTVSFTNINWREWQKPEIITDLLTPKAKHHVDDIAYWIFFWPFVVVSTLFKDLFIKLAKHTARFFDWAFNRMSRLLISNAAKDI